MKFLYANYYFNFDFNVTCITGKQTTTNILHKNLFKAPSHKWEHLRNARQSISDLRSYDWEQAVGLGVVLGYNRLRALDIDGCEDFTLIDDFLEILNFPSNYKWLIQSGSKKGFHILFYSDNHKFNVLKNKVKAFKSNSNFKMIFKHIELRWIGHLVLPPSLHTSTMHYQFLNGIPLEAPSEIALENLYGLLKKYCSGKSLKKDEETEEVRDDSGVYIEEDEEIEEVRDDSGVYIEEDEEIEEVRDDSGVYIEEDEEIEEVRDDSGVYIDIYKEPYYLFFDTETTGLPKNWKAPVTDLNNWPRLVQLAFLYYDSNGTKISGGDFIIKPEGFTIPIDASRIHGISTEKALREGQSITSVLQHFNALIEQASYLVAHNMSFDEKIVGSEFLRNGMQNSIPSKNKICTMEKSTNFCAIDGPYGYKWPKLSELHYKLL
jgi:DNA polymerase III epsilon subunit-like protein